MAIVYRNGRPYLYRSKRQGGRVTSQYIGSSKDALLIDALETIEKDEKDYDSRQIRCERQEADDLEQALDDLAKRAQYLAREALSAAGYHQHHRGECRKLRVSRHREGEDHQSGDGQLGSHRAD